MTTTLITLALIYCTLGLIYAVRSVANFSTPPKRDGLDITMTLAVVLVCVLIWPYVVWDDWKRGVLQ